MIVCMFVVWVLCHYIHSNSSLRGSSVIIYRYILGWSANVLCSSCSELKGWQECVFSFQNAILCHSVPFQLCLVSLQFQWSITMSDAGFYFRVGFKIICRFLTIFGCPTIPQHKSCELCCFAGLPLTQCQALEALLMITFSLFIQLLSWLIDYWVCHLA